MQCPIKHFKIEFLGLFLFGVGGGLAFAPYHYWILLSASLTFLLWRLDPIQTAKKAAQITWMWSFGLFLLGFHWVSFSLGVDLWKFGWLLPFSILGIPAVLACIPALSGGLSVRLASPGLSRWIIFASLWGVGEWIRGQWLFGGISWNIMATIWGHSPTCLQSLKIGGPYFLSTLTLLLLSLPYLWITPHLSVIKRWLWSVSLISATCLVVFWGYLSIKPVAPVPHCWMRLVQPNIPQKQKWDQSFQAQQIIDLFSLTERPSAFPLTHILWPEAPLPFTLVQPDLRGCRLPLYRNQILLTGMHRLTQSQDKRFAWNSLMILDAQGRTYGCYDKVHRVPFGEYIPGRTFLSRFFSMDWLKKITAGPQDISAGARPVTLAIPGAPKVSPLICFDVAFPGEVTDPTERPSWMWSATNDAWFEDSWGLSQHFELGRLRAIEEGLPLVCVSNTGISGVFDPYGQLVATLPSQQKAVLDFQLPQACPPTFYTRFREVPFFCLTVLLLLGGLWMNPRKSTQRKRRKTASR